MKTALTTLVIAVAAPMAVIAVPGVPDYVMSDITEKCLENVADDDQATESDEDCIAIAVENYKKANPQIDLSTAADSSKQGIPRQKDPSNANITAKPVTPAKKAAEAGSKQSCNYVLQLAFSTLHPILSNG